MILSSICAVCPAASLSPWLSFWFSSCRDWFFSIRDWRLSEAAKPLQQQGTVGCEFGLWDSTTRIIIIH